MTHEHLSHPVRYDRAFSAAGWLYEPQLDGMRAVAMKRGADVRLTSNRGRSLGDRFPEVIDAVRALPDLVLDGELVVPGECERTSYRAVQARSLMRACLSIAAGSKTATAALCAFDVLWWQGRDVRAWPLRDRKLLLGELLPRSGPVYAIGWTERHGEALFAKAVSLNWEGIVAKKLDCPYRAGRERSWRKIPNPAYSRDPAGE